MVGAVRAHDPQPGPLAVHEDVHGIPDVHHPRAVGSDLRIGGEFEAEHVLELEDGQGFVLGQGVRGRKSHPGGSEDGRQPPARRETTREWGGHWATLSKRPGRCGTPAANPVRGRERNPGLRQIGSPLSICRVPRRQRTVRTFHTPPRRGFRASARCRPEAGAPNAYSPTRALKKSLKVPWVWARCWARKPIITMVPSPWSTETMAALSAMASSPSSQPLCRMSRPG